MLRVSPPACSIRISPSAALHYAGELFSPLHQQDCVFRDQLIEADGLQLALVLDAIKIDVVELDFLVLAVDLRLPSYS